MSNKIKASVVETNDICQHRKDCCHPHCDCGMDVAQAVDHQLNYDLLERSKTLTWTLNFERQTGAKYYTPLDHYNSLIAKRNRKVEQGIPLSYGK